MGAGSSADGFDGTGETPLSANDQGRQDAKDRTHQDPNQNLVLDFNATTQTQVGISDSPRKRAAATDRLRPDQDQPLDSPSKAKRRKSLPGAGTAKHSTTSPVSVQRPRSSGATHDRERERGKEAPNETTKLLNHLHSQIDLYRQSNELLEDQIRQTLDTKRDGSDVYTRTLNDLTLARTSLRKVQAINKTLVSDLARLAKEFSRPDRETKRNTMADLNRQIALYREKIATQLEQRNASLKNGIQTTSYMDTLEQKVRALQKELAPLQLQLAASPSHRRNNNSNNNNDSGSPQGGNNHSSHKQRTLFSFPPVPASPTAASSSPVRQSISPTSPKFFASVPTSPRAVVLPSSPTAFFPSAERFPALLSPSSVAAVTASHLAELQTQVSALSQQTNESRESAAIAAVQLARLNTQLTAARRALQEKDAQVQALNEEIAKLPTPPPRSTREPVVSPRVKLRWW